MIQLVAFLGNPGREYAGNRHNAGRMLAHILTQPDIHAMPFFPGLEWQKKFKGLYAAVNGTQVLCALGKALPQGEIPQEEKTSLAERVHFLMPETYMNLSGGPILGAASFFKIKPQEILLVHDELEIPLGAISLKFSGGLGGHNGLRSMKAGFGTADFWRLRLGIGRPDSRLPGEGGPAGSGRDIAGWVLSDFSAAEQEALGPVLDAGAGLLLRALADGPQMLLPEWAKKIVYKQEQK